VTDIQQDAPPAGWYPDPVRPGASRYWSGVGWTDQVSAPAVATAAGALDAGPAVGEPPVTFAPPPAHPTERHSSQSEWHQSRAQQSVRRPVVASVSTTTRAASSASRAHDPYDRNWIAVVAIVLAVLSIPALAARVLWDLPALTQSIFAGAPVGISLLALASGVRRRSGIVLSIVAVVLSLVTLVAAWVVDPALIRGAVDGIAGLFPA